MKKENTRYIISLCHQLQQQGQTPTLARIRNKASRPLAIPDIIAVLKTWKEDPESLANLPPVEQTEKSPSQDLEERVILLEEKMEKLIALVESSFKSGSKRTDEGR